MPGAMDAPALVSYGPVPGSVYCGHRFMDVLVHGWDVATSTGQDTTLDADLVDACWAVVEPQLEQLVGTRRVRHDHDDPRRRLTRRRVSSPHSAVTADRRGVVDSLAPKAQRAEGAQHLVCGPYGPRDHRDRARRRVPTVRIFDCNRSITGMAIESYSSIEERPAAGRPTCSLGGSSTWVPPG